MRLYIIRHGETDWNRLGRLQGQTDTELNEKGIRLAQVTAEGVRDIPFDLAITSPLKRSRQTAEQIINGREIPLLEDSRLMEIGFGSWEGKGCRPHNMELPPEFDKFYTDPFGYRPPEGGESVRQVCRRTGAFFAQMLETPEYRDKTILIATHGCACRALLNRVYEDKEDFWHGHVPPNCAVNVVEVQNGRPVLIEEDRIYYDRGECVDFRTGKKLEG